MNNITMTLQVDHLIMEALREDISSEDVTTNAVMHEAVTGEVDQHIRTGHGLNRCAIARQVQVILVA